MVAMTAATAISRTVCTTSSTPTALLRAPSMNSGSTCLQERRVLGPSSGGVTACDSLSNAGTRGRPWQQAAGRAAAGRVLREHREAVNSSRPGSMLPHTPVHPPRAPSRCWSGTLLYGTTLYWVQGGRTRTLCTRSGSAAATAPAPCCGTSLDSSGCTGQGRW
jgi:hypothetical protein